MTRHRLQSVFWLLFALYAIIIVVVECKVSDELQIRLPHGGGIAGKFLTSHKGRGIRAFQGVPYAEAPVGELRFSNPKPKLPWSGYIAATNGTKHCPQLLGDTVTGDEDCLYVNVYTPLQPKTEGPLPVMFFIHGGGFVSGSGAYQYYGPEYLLDHDVVYITGNYRLGALGFLSLGNEEVPGNFGLKDQHLILQWIQDNIAAFNGDPDQVTIFGESAGSASVAYHLISSNSYKLFHKAILQSGTQYAPWAFDHFGTNVRNTVVLANSLNCPIKNVKEDIENFLDCIREKTPEEIILTLGARTVGFLPTVEASMTGFIQKSPTSFTRSLGLDIPIMIGVTSEEGALFSALFSEGDMNNLWAMDPSLIETFISGMITVPGLDADGKKQAQQIVKDYYFKNGRFERQHNDNVTNFFTDGHFLAPLDEFLVNRLVTNENSADTFVYLFSHRGSVTALDLFPALGFPEVELDMDLGVCHLDDVIYLFPIAEQLVPHRVPTKADAYIQTLLTEMWVNFATNGQPSSSTVSDLTWKPANGYPLDFLRIGNHGHPEKDVLGMEKGLLEERINVWRHLKETSTQASGDKKENDKKDEL